MSKADESKQSICEAAVRVAARDGFAAMSLDSVAKEAGVSKGGLIYHFRNKEELVHGTMEHFAASGRQMLLERLAADPTPHMRWGRGFVSCLFPSKSEQASLPEGMTAQTMLQFMVAMMSMASDRRLDASPLTEMGREIRDRLLEEEGDQGLEQLLIWLSIDGLLVWQVLGLIEADDPLFERIGDQLRERVGLPEREKPKPKRKRGGKR